MMRDNLSLNMVILFELIDKGKTLKVASHLFALLSCIGNPQRKRWLEVKALCFFLAAVASSLSCLESWVNNLNVSDTKSVGLSPL